MARAAVRAKQAQAAQARAAAKPSRKQRRHASGGNPNQELFFSRLRRRQKWVFLVLAVLFAISFTLLGVGSGGGGQGLEQNFLDLFGAGSDPVGQAQAEIKTNPAKGYKDLANAYVTKNDLASAIIAMNLYLQKINPKDSAAWAQLGGWEGTQASTYATEYQQVLQNAEAQSPNSLLQPSGQFANALGTNPIDSYYSQQSQALSGPLYQKAVTAYNASLADYQNAAKYAKHDQLAQAELSVYSAAHNAGNAKAELAALKKYVEVSPHATNLSAVEAACRQLGGSCVPKHKK